MAADRVVEYWAEILARMPVTPELMVQWKRVLDRGIEAWSRALSEVMATEEFAHRRQGRPSSSRGWPPRCDGSKNACGMWKSESGSAPSPRAGRP